MIKLIRKAFFRILMVLILCSSLCLFFLCSTPGLYTLIKVSQFYIPGTFKIYKLKGQLLNNFRIGRLEYESNHEKITLHQVSMNWKIDSLLPYHFLIDRFSVAKIDIQRNKSIKTLSNCSFNGSASDKNLLIDSLKCSYLDQILLAQLQLKYTQPDGLTALIKLNPDNRSKKILSGVLNVEGNLNRLQYHGTFQGLAEGNLNGTLDQFSKIKFVGLWHNLLRGNSKYSLQSSEGMVKLTGTLPNLTIEVNSKVNKPQQQSWDCIATIKGTIPWQWAFDINLSPSVANASVTSGLFTTLTMKGFIQNQNHAQADLLLEPGRYYMPENGVFDSFEFQGGSLKVILLPNELSGKGLLSIDSTKQAKFTFNLPKFTLDQSISEDQPVKGNISIFINSLDFIQKLHSGVKNIHGHLKASLNLKGTFGQPIVESSFKLSNASLDIPKQGLNLNAINMSVVGKEKKWVATGSIRSTNKLLNINGEGQISLAPNGIFTIQGVDFPIVNNKVCQIQISPQLSLNLTPTGINIMGTILVPYAQIKPQTFSSSVALPEDVIIKDDQKVSLNPFYTAMDIRLEMGDHVGLNFKGLQANLIGMINMKQLPNKPIKAIGELLVKNGVYKAYGHNLTIEHGQLIFTGGRLDNPGVNLRAGKTINTSTNQLSNYNQLFNFKNNIQKANLNGKISVGVEVTGQLSEPKIHLFSNPSILSQADILSMLVLGRPASQANKAGGQLLLAALSSMTNDDGTNNKHLLDQLKESTGLDFNIKTNSKYNLLTNQVSDTTGLVVGKSLAKKIYLSYNVGLSQADPNILTLKYLLSKFISIQLSGSDTNSGIDVLYTSISRGKDLPK
jgi:translocation and assembly module TamB